MKTKSLIRLGVTFGPPLLALVLFACSANPPGDPCSTNADCSGRACVDGRCAAAIDASSADAGTDAGVMRDAGSDTGTRDDAGPPCVATETPEVSCNRLDDDCNGFVDDVDVAMDGFCDCLSLAVIGNPGANPASNFQSWLERMGTSVTRFGTVGGTTLTAEMLSPYDVIIIDSLPAALTVDESALLRAYVEGGGGLMVMTGYNGSTDRGIANSALVAFEVEYLAGLQTSPVSDWMTHPISVGITSVSFMGGYHVALTGAGAGTVVARLPTGTVGMALERGVGRAFVWGDEWIEFDSEWSTMPMIQQLWANILGWLGPRDRCVILD